MEDIELEVRADGVTVDGVDATIEIRGPEVSRAVSIVAANPAVRAEMVRRQREWVAAHDGGVLEGRDIGTVVFPDAELKVYLTADPEVRAQRRSQGGHRPRLRDGRRRPGPPRRPRPGPGGVAPHGGRTTRSCSTPPGMTVEEIVDTIAGKLGHGRVDG